MKYSTNPYRGRKKEERTRELGKRNAALPSTGEKIERLFGKTRFHSTLSSGVYCTHSDGYFLYACYLLYLLKYSVYSRANIPCPNWCLITILF